MDSAPPLLVMDYIGPVIGAAAFVFVMSLVQEPGRRTLNAILVAGASGVYLSGGFGPLELLYPAVVTPIVYLGLAAGGESLAAFDGRGIARLGATPDVRHGLRRAYRFIGLAWLMHSGWDSVHHFWGNPIWPFMPTSSFGCMVFDALIAVWFLAGAPSLLTAGSREHARQPGAGAGSTTS